MSSEILDLFRQTNALLEGHFILRSGLHSRQFFQCALLLRETQIAARVCGMLANRLRGIEADAVASRRWWTGAAVTCRTSAAHSSR